MAKAAYSYAIFKRLADAIAYRDNCFAMGTVSPSEVYGIIYRAGRYHFMLKLECEVI